MSEELEGMMTLMAAASRPERTLRVGWVERAAGSRQLAAASGPCRELAAASRPLTGDRFVIVP